MKLILSVLKVARLNDLFITAAFVELKEVLAAPIVTEMNDCLGWQRQS